MKTFLTNAHARPRTKGEEHKGVSLLAVARTEPLGVESVRVGEELRVVMKGVHWYHNPQPFLYFQT